MKPESHTREWLAERDDEAVMFDGLDGAVVGMGVRCGQPPIVVYDRARILRILVERDGMTEDEADEFCAFHIEGGWLGPRTPIVVERITQRTGRKRSTNTEIERLRQALRHIAENHDEPYARDYALDALKSRTVP